MNKDFIRSFVRVEMALDEDMRVNVKDLKLTKMETLSLNTFSVDIPAIGMHKSVFLAITVEPDSSLLFNQTKDRESGVISLSYNEFPGGNLRYNLLIKSKDVTEIDIAPISLTKLFLATALVLFLMMLWVFSMYACRYLYASFKAKRRFVPLPIKNKRKKEKVEYSDFEGNNNSIDSPEDTTEF